MCTALSSSISKASTPTFLLMTPMPKDLPRPVFLHPHLSRTHLENLVAFCIRSSNTLTFNDALFVAQVMELNPRGAFRKSKQSSALVGANIYHCPGYAGSLSATRHCFSLPSPVPHRAPRFKLSPPNTTTFFQTCFSLSQFCHSSCVYLPLQLHKFVLVGFDLGV